VIGLISAAIGVLAGSFWQWKQDNDKYRVMTFEKRLDVYQKLYSINQSLYGKIGNYTEINSLLTNLKEFWGNNSLYLDANTRRSTIELIGNTTNYKIQLDNQPRNPIAIDTMEKRFINTLNKNLDDIQKGAGAEHLSRTNNQDAQGGTNPPAHKIHVWNKFTRWLKENLGTIPFVVVAIGTAVYLIFTAFNVPPPPGISQLNWTLNSYKYLCYSIASLAGILITLRGTKDNFIRLVVFITVEIFLFGMVFELLGFIIR